MLFLLLICAGTSFSEEIGPTDKRVRWEKKWGPLVPHKTFPKDCSLCHIAKRWDVLRSDFNFDHLKETGYPLLGAHAQASCLRCHNDRGPIKPYVARGCGGCHIDPHKDAFGSDCTKCHNQTTWARQGMQGQKVAEHARTRFPLTGIHATLPCQQCHIRASASDFRGTTLDCASCHQQDLARAHTSPASNHTANNFPSTCQNCHTTVAFGPGTQMQHQFVAGIACITCHTGDFQAAPNHVTMSFSQNCQNCHTGTTTWLGALFDHSTLGPNPICFNCHSAEYASAKSTPASNHPGNGFPTTCQNCHTYALWGPGTQMQHQYVGGTGATCQMCHMTDYTAATSPVNHAAQGIPSSSCNTCHQSFSTWNSFIHNPSNCYNSTTNASHHNATCAQCHPGANYATGSCTACHGSNPGNSCG